MANVHDQQEPDEWLSFVEAPTFVEQLAELAGTAHQLDLLYRIQRELLLDPERGDLVKGLGGIRKARIADPRSKSGKSGGFRYLYLYFELRGRIHLLYLYSKREQADLDNEARKQLATLAAKLKQAAQTNRSESNEERKF